MNIKFAVTICIVVIFAILLGLFVRFYKESTLCYGFHASCIRFCNDDTENYSNEFLIKELINSKSGNYLKNDSLIYRGPPTCGGISFWPPKHNETSNRSPYFIDSNGVLEVELENFDQKRYCFEKSDDVYDGWKVFICDRDRTIRKIFYLIIISASLIMYGIVLFVYSSNRELRDFHGKWTIIFIASQIVTLILFPYCALNEFRYNFKYRYLENIYNLFVISLMLGILWITVLVFHEYFTFKNFKSQKEIPYNFSKYVVFTTVLAIFLIVLFCSPLDILSMLYLFIGFLDIAVWIVTGFNIFSLSRQPLYSTQARFNIEKRWFWNCIKLSSMLVITWIIQYLILGRYFNIFHYIIADSILLLTSISITIIALERKKVKDLKNQDYTEVSNTNADKSEEKLNTEDIKV